MHFEEILKCHSNLQVDTVRKELSVFQLTSKNFKDLKKRKRNDLDESDQIDWNCLMMSTHLKLTLELQTKGSLLISTQLSQDLIYVTLFQCLMILILTSLIWITCRKNLKRWVKLNQPNLLKHLSKHQLNTEIFKNPITLLMWREGWLLEVLLMESIGLILYDDLKEARDWSLLKTITNHHMNHNQCLVIFSQNVNQSVAFHYSFQYHHFKSQLNMFQEAHLPLLKMRQDQALTVF